MKRNGEEKVERVKDAATKASREQRRQLDELAGKILKQLAGHEEPVATLAMPFVHSSQSGLVAHVANTALQAGWSIVGTYNTQDGLLALVVQRQSRIIQ